MKTFCRLSYRVPFSETDAMGIVHHSNHARYLERGRVEFMRLTGLNYVDIMKQGFHFPLTDMHISYKKPLAFDDILLVETEISEVSAVRLNFSYRIFTGAEPQESQITTVPYQGTIAVVGETHHCCVNNSGRPVPMESSMKKKFSDLGGEK